MRLRSAREPAPWAWGALPPEIQNEILYTIAAQRNPGWGSHAAVCRAWRNVLEPRNFATLNLRLSCLDDFPRVVPANSRLKRLVRHICLTIELPRYVPKCCAARQTPSTDAGAVVHDGLTQLFTILSRWRRQGDLTFELNVYSPSDATHCFPNIYLNSDYVEGKPAPGPMLHVWKNGVPYHDPPHGWVEGRQQRCAPVNSVKRLFEPITLNHLIRPRVSAVTCFVMRRQLRRCIDSWGVQCILASLVNLQKICYEPWEPLEPLIQSQFDGFYYRWLRSGEFRTVKSLVVFKDTPSIYNQFARSLPVRTPASASGTLGTDSDASNTLGELFAINSLQLQHLAIAFQVDAEQVLCNFPPDWTWPHLQSLALTSPTLDESSSDRAIQALLCLAAELVPRMPNLKTLVLWNGGRPNACAFIFRQTDSRTASITWRGNWRFSFTPDVLKSWRKVAEDRGVTLYSILYESIEADINSRGDAIHHLQLPCPVITPESLWQIRREAYTIDDKIS